MTRLRIERLSHRGYGIAPGPVYVPGALPGECVEGRVDGTVMHDRRIVEPVADRVRPTCRHAGPCGGCQMQHAADGFVAAWKRAVVTEALAAHGIDRAPDAIHTSPPRSRRRATFSARRTKKGALAGFHARRSDTIVAVPDCHLVRPALAQALPLVEALAQLGSSRKAELSVLVTDSLAGLDVTVRGGKPPDSALQAGLADLARAHDLARLTWEGETLLRRDPVQAIGRAELVPPPGAFLQATAEGEAALLRGVNAAVGDARSVVDLFAGCGTFSLPLADRARVHAVEGDGDMLAALDRAVRMTQGLKPVTTARRDLFRDPLDAPELADFDAAVIDPPRAGAAAQVARILAGGIPRVAYVSCNPVTFARDAAQMTAAGYVIDRLDVVDQFRWSAHVELVAALRLEG